MYSTEIVWWESKICPRQNGNPALVFLMLLYELS